MPLHMHHYPIIEGASGLLLGTTLCVGVVKLWESRKIRTHNNFSNLTTAGTVMFHM